MKDTIVQGLAQAYGNLVHMVADFLLSGEETRWSEHRYSVEIYKLDPRFSFHASRLLRGMASCEASPALPMARPTS